MKKLLLVEDNERLMDINAEFLRDMGYAVSEAFSLAEAEECLRLEKPDCLILDIMLPDGDGVDFCARLRAGSDIPVLFLSARSSSSDIVDGLRRGGDDYLTKPYDLNVLAAHVEALLRRAKPGGDERVRIGPLSFDVPLALAYVDNRLLNLTAKEYGVLYTLAQHMNMVISRNELYRTVWGQDISHDGKALWTAVSRLKKKIAPYSARFALESSHKGYMLSLR